MKNLRKVLCSILTCVLALNLIYGLHIVNAEKEMTVSAETAPENEKTITENIQPNNSDEYNFLEDSAAAEKESSETVTDETAELAAANANWITAEKLSENEKKQFTINSTDEVLWYKVTLTGNDETIKLTIDRDGWAFNNLYYYIYTEQTLIEGKDNSIGYDYFSNTSTNNFKTSQPGNYYVKIYGDVNEEPLNISYTIVPPDENENNDTWQNAALLSENQAKQFTITANNGSGSSPDYDWFKITLNNPDETIKLTIDKDGWTFNNLYYNIYTEQTLVEGKNNIIGSSYKYFSNTLTNNFKTSQPGNYYVKVYGDVNEEPLNISYTIVPPDENENNDTWQNAALLSKNQAKQFTITANNSSGSSPDYDWFKISVPNDNQAIKIKIYNDDGSDFENDLQCSLYDEKTLKANGSSYIAYKNYISKYNNFNMAKVDAGNYYLKIYGGINLKPVNISYALVPPDANETNDTWLTATSLQTDVSSQFTINAPNDTDWFKIGVPKAGENVSLTIQSLDGLDFDNQIFYNVYTEATLKANGSSTVKSGYRTKFISDTFTAADSGNYYIKITSNVHERPLLITYSLGSVNTGVTGVSLDKQSVTLPLDESIQLYAQTIPANATNKGFEWTSSNVNVATVDAYGTVKPNNTTGTSRITVTTKEGGFTAYCDVNVVQSSIVKVTGLSLDKTSADLRKGETLNLKTNITPSNATNKNIRWNTSNINVASVSNGTVTAKAQGTAEITATSEDGGFKSVCLVNVTAPDAKAEGVQLDKHSLSIPAGGAASLNVTFIPIYASNQNVTWSSDNTAVVLVDKNGKITAISAGSANVTVKSEDGGFTDTCSVTVNESPKTYDYSIEDLEILSETGEALSSIPENGNFIIQASYKKNTNRNTNDYFIIAYYDTKGSMIGFNYSLMNPVSGKNIAFGTLIPQKDKKVSKVKAFVWDGLSSMNSLAESIER